jgi:hypothetical protein
MIWVYSGWCVLEVLRILFGRREVLAPEIAWNFMRPRRI